MKRIRRKKCRNCKELFHPDQRNRRHQKYCSNAECRKASKKVRQKSWLNKPENRDYFRGPEQVERVRAWRVENRGYWRRERRRTLQDVLLAQGAETTKESGSLNQSTLQDILLSQPFVMLGLIAQLIGSTLQDDIASTAGQLLSLGRDIMGGENDQKASNTTRTDTQGPAKIQLGGPAASA